MVLPRCNETIQPHPDYPQLIDLQQKFVQVIESTLVEDTSLAFRVQKSQLAVRDLAAQVRARDLTPKDALVGNLERFVAEAVDATDGLFILGARVGGAIDRRVYASTSSRQLLISMYRILAVDQ